MDHFIVFLCIPDCSSCTSYTGIVQKSSGHRCDQVFSEKRGFTAIKRQICASQHCKLQTGSTALDAKTVFLHSCSLISETTRRLESLYLINIELSSSGCGYWRWDWLSNTKKQRPTTDFLTLVSLESAKLSASGETMNEVYKVMAL